jgi:uncharacterized protein YdaU (DUF1376 family)
MHYYQFHIGDYTSHTAHLTNLEDLAYRRLLDLYYDKETPIPNDIPLVSRRIRMGCSEVETVLKEFFVLVDDGWKNMRSDLEIREYHEFLAKQKANGKLGGRPKKTQAYPKPNPRKTQAEPKITLTNSHKPLTIDIQATAKLPICPVDEIINAYHSSLPELPSVRLVSEKRITTVKKFWKFVLTSKKTDGTPRATNEAEALEWIKAYFMRVRDNAFLMGKIGRVGEHAGWQCDFDYLLTERGMTQVIEKTKEAA